MNKPSPESQIQQLEAALQQGSRPSRFQGILMLFWGLIFAKLFIVEYAVQIYEIPVNSVIYIWSLTLIMGSACTFAYLKAGPVRESYRARSQRLLRDIWLACFVAMILGAAASFLLATVNPFHTPAFFALILGIGFFLQGGIYEGNVFRILGVAWWGAALFLFTRVDVQSFAWFSLFLILFQVIPTAWLHFLSGAEKES